MGLGNGVMECLAYVLECIAKDKICYRLDFLIKLTKQWSSCIVLNASMFTTLKGLNMLILMEHILELAFLTCFSWYIQNIDQNVQQTNMKQDSMALKYMILHINFNKESPLTQPRLGMRETIIYSINIIVNQSL